MPKNEVKTIDALFVINPVFSTGQIVASRGVYDLACQNPKFAKFIQKSLNRHVKGDWGDVDDEDKETLRGVLAPYCDQFGLNLDELLAAPFTRILSQTTRPYGQLYAY